VTLAPDLAAAFDRGAGLPPVAATRWASPLDLACALNPAFRRTPALELINDALVWAENTHSARLIVVMSPQEGKGLALDTPVATPDGWTTMGDLTAGAVIFGGDGHPCRVTAAFPTRHLDCYRVTLQDGSTLTADGDHKWRVWDRHGYDPEERAAGGSGRRCWRVVDTRELARDPRRYSVPTQPALNLPARDDLPLPPYVIGAWLGDGNTADAGFTCADQEIIDQVDAEGWPLRSQPSNGPYSWTWAGPVKGRRGDPSRFQARLRNLGVLGDKHIPVRYLRGSYDQRLALLQGLMDTDGSCYFNGTAYSACEFTTTNRRLADDVMTLVRSLGIRCYRIERRATLRGRDCGPAWKIKFTTDVPVFRLTRKLDRLYAVPSARKVRERIGVKTVEPVPTVPTRCITVDSPDSTFLAGRDLVPTHNSELCSHYGPLWSLVRNPRKRIAVASYGDRLARRWGRKVRDDLKAFGPGASTNLGVTVAPDVAAADEWETAHGGGMVTAGVHTGLTGRPVDDLRIDDPVKDREQADSLVMRDGVWDFYTETAIPRLSPGAPAVVVMTRWHWDDLVGRLLIREAGQWRVVHIPAQADPDVVDPDPLGREPGEFMVSARGRTLEDWQSRKREMGEGWMPLAQGLPARPGGEAFEVDKLRYWHLTADGTGLVMGPRIWKLADCYRFLTVDTAISTKQSADWTVVSAWAATPDGMLVLLDVARDRVPPHKQFDLARPLTEQWIPDCTYVEPSMKSTHLVRDLAANGLTVDDLKADQDKQVRAVPAERMVAQRRVWFPAQHQHLDVFREEMGAFPHGRYDDCVDTLSYAELVRFQRYVPPSGGGGAVEPARPADPYGGAFGVPLDYDQVQL